ncbi:MAG: hypothetical protein ACRDS9_12520 [Pseudonocardiaceae bacterium]
MEIGPVEDLAELAEISKLEEEIPLTMFPYAHALRMDGERRAGGFTFREEPAEPGERLRNIEANQLNAAAGQARRVLRMLCSKSRYASYGRKESCGALVAEWQHLVGGRRSADGRKCVPQVEWEQRQVDWGSSAEPWCGWLVDAVSGRKFRDYQDGHVTVSCPRCGRQEIRIGLRRVQETLAEDRSAATLKVPI